MSDSIQDLIHEKCENEKQLSAFQKKESKSNWYRKHKNINNTGTEHAQKAKKMAHNFFRKGEPNQGNKSVSTSALPRSNVITVTNDVSRDDEGASPTVLERNKSNSSAINVNDATDGKPTVFDEADRESISSGDTLPIFLFSRPLPESQGF